MELIKVCDGRYVRVESVGAVDVVRVLDENAKIRTTTTTIMDLTGQNVLSFIETEVSTVIPNSYKYAVMRDNFIHDEVIAAIREERDAREWVDPEE